MKRYIKLAGFIFFLLSLPFSVRAEGNPERQLSGTGGRSAVSVQDDETFMPEKTVYLVLWNGCEEACRGFQDYLQSARLPVSVIVRDAKKNIANLPDFVKEAQTLRPDLIVTWGTLATLEMLGGERDGLSEKYVRSAPAVFMVVSQPVESGLVSGLVTQGRNITGVTHLVPVVEQLQLARQFIAFKRLGIIYNPAETNAAVTVDQIKKYAPLMNFEVADRPVPLKNGKPDAEEIASLTAEMADKGVDLIYLGTDAFMNRNRRALSDAAFAYNIPVFSASEAAVRSKDALFAFVHRYYNVGQAAGNKASKILWGNIPAYDIPIESPQRPLFVINMDAAVKLNVFPPFSLLQGADMVNVPSGFEK